MVNYEDDLLKIFEDDKDQILNNPARPTPLSKDQKLLDSFSEINSFVKTNEREPQLGDNIFERKLAARLSQIKGDSELNKILKPFDEHNLLGEIKEINSIEDIFENDPLNILDVSDEDELFDIKNFRLEERFT